MLHRIDQIGKHVTEAAWERANGDKSAFKGSLISMLRLPAISRLILTVFKLRTVTKMIKEITCLSVMKVMISRTLLIPRQISMATYIFWPAHHPPSAQIIMMMKHPPYPALLHPVEVAAPSKRGPSAFILAS